MFFIFPPRGFNPLSSYENKGLKPFGGNLKMEINFLHSIYYKKLEIRNLRF